MKKAKSLFLDVDNKQYYRKRLRMFLDLGYVKGRFHYVRGGSSRQEMILKDD